MAYRPSQELLDLIQKLLPQESDQFFNSLGRQFPHTIRFNTLMGKKEDLIAFLRKQGFEFEQFPNFDDIFRLIYQPYPIGKSLSHFLGHFYVQDVSSMIPPKVLQPQPGDLVLDVSAAPGSKTTQMAIMMENKGAIIANDIVMKRLRALISNLQRCGILNTGVVKNYGESFGRQYHEVFDKILLDPACSGLGTLHKSPEVLSWWTSNHCIRLAASQKQLIKSALKALKPGGTMVYSTCTLTPEENEEVLDFALNEFPIELLEIDLPGLVMRPGITEFEDRKYHPSVQRARRLYPFENQSEGFFIAKIRKTDSMPQDERRERRPIVFNYKSHSDSPVKKYLDFLTSHFGIPRNKFTDLKFHIDKNITAVSKELADFQFKTKPLKTGITIAHPMTQIAKFTTEGTLNFGQQAKSRCIDLNLDDLEKYVNRENLDYDGDIKIQAIVKHENLPIGYAMIQHEKLKSQFPKAEWPFALVQKENENNSKIDPVDEV